MGIIDIILLILIGVFAIKGLFKGLVMEIFGILALIAGYITGFKYSHVFSKPVAALGLDEKASAAIGYVIGFLVAYIIVVIIGSVLSKAFKEVKLSSLNRGGGFFFGGIKAAIILGLILSAVITVAPKNGEFSKNLQDGMVSGKLAKISPFVYKAMNHIPDVKKINPFDIPQVKKAKDALEKLEDDAVQDALKSVKDSEVMKEATEMKDKALESAEEMMKKKPAIEPNEEPLEDPLKDMQKE
ncbi:MAG: colicin V production protein [Denitrovibrio sp.]|nr:MAG: colicin V production protein [Denitrovibrio sp.]